MEFCHYTLHLCDWLGEKNYIAETETGLKADGSNVKAFMRFLHCYRIDKKRLLEEMEIVLDVKNEPSPIPCFVTNYEVKWGASPHFWDDIYVEVIPHLTEKGCLRQALEKGERLAEGRKEIFHPMTPFGRISF